MDQDQDRQAVQAAVDEAVGRAAWKIDEVAERYGLGRTTIYAELKAGRLRAIRVGRARRILSSELERWQAERLAEAQ